MGNSIGSQFLSELIKAELSECCRSESLSEDGLRRIIEQHGAADLNIKNCGFLHLACRNERITEGILRYLIANFPSNARSVTDDKGVAPLHIICINKNVTLGMVQLLIDAFPGSLRHPDNNGRMPLHRFCNNKHLDDEVGLEILKLLLERCPESARHVAGDGNLPIHYASMYQSPEFCRILVEAYPGSERMVSTVVLLPFHFACVSNTVATAKYLYQFYPESIHVATYDGWYPIHFAIMGLEDRGSPKDGIEVLRFLLECNPDALSSREETPLHIACGNKNVTLGMVQLLIDAFPESVRHENNIGFIPLHTLCRNNDLGEEGGLEILKLLVKSCPESVRHAAGDGILPIHLAAMKQSPEFCRLLIETYPGSERMTDNDGILPFHLACRYNTVATVKYLYELYPECINMAENNEAHPIHSTILGLTCRSYPKDGIEVLKFLLDCNPNALSSTVPTLLHIACGNLLSKNVTLGMVQLLVDAFPDSLLHENNKGGLPLHVLCCNNNLGEEVGLQILKLLIEKCPESVRHAAGTGSLPIHVAAAWESPEFCRMLIEAYPGSERTTNGNGWLPFHFACLTNTVATVKYLYELYPESINVTGNGGFYPIHCAIQRPVEINQETAIDVVQFLIDCDPNVALQEFEGKVLLYLICNEATSENTQQRLHAYLKILQILYDLYPGAIERDEVTSGVGEFCAEVQTFINTQLSYARQARDQHLMTTSDENGKLPLHRAIHDNVNLGSIKLLVKGNPSAIICADNSGALPLHMACQHHESASVVEYLVGLDSDTLTIVDREGNTALHHACRGAKYGTVALLLGGYGVASVSKRNVHNKLPIHLLLESNEVRDREDTKYLEGIYRLLRAYPETLMHCTEFQGGLSQNRKKRKMDEVG